MATRIKMSALRMGENAGGWKGGVSILNERIRKSFLYREWRRSVFERDGYCCVFCSKKGGKIHADHIKAYSLILLENNILTFEQAMGCQELWDVENGRTLCLACHKKTDTYGNRKKI